MKTDADLRAYCESRFPIGEPTRAAFSVTGEEYVVIGQEANPDELSLPGIVREGKESLRNVGAKNALWAARMSFDAYANGKVGMLYWRAPPQLKQSGDYWRVYMRCLISGKLADPAYSYLVEKSEAA